MMQTSTHLSNTVKLYSNDPLATILLRITRQSIWRLFLFLVIVYGFLGLGLGLLVSLYYTRLGVNFVSILDTRELPAVIFVGVIVCPAIWTSYMWQPSAIIYTFNSFQEKQLINIQDRVSFKDFIDNTTEAYESITFPAIAIIITIFSVLFWTSS